MTIYINADRYLLNKIDWAQRQLGMHVESVPDTIDEICKHAVSYKKQFTFLLSLFLSTIRQVCRVLPEKDEMKGNLKTLYRELEGYKKKEIK